MNLASSRLTVATFAIIAGIVVQADTELAWWRTTTLYEIWPRSFKDSNGDGIGDLNGITSKLDYLSDLGIGAIWIAPCFSSPQADTGYDVSNYRDIDPLYGTLEDMDALIARATELGIKVILDYVPNHTSTEHMWFKLSEASVDPYTDYYVWHEGILDANGTRKPPNNWLSRFNSGSAWEWSNKRQAYYFHQFNKEQPDLDFRNEAVIQESLDILTFWMDRGVAGFRIDALPFLFEDPQFRDEPLSGLDRYAPHEYFYLDHIYTKDLMEIYDLVARWRKHLDEYIAKNPGLERVMFTESYANISMISLFYDYGVNFPFNFFLIGNRTTSYTLKTQTATNLKNIIDEWMEYTPAGQTPNWVIGNHDRSRVASRFGSEKVDTFNILLLFLPGVPTIYNGEEIGMVNTFLTWEESEDPKACNSDPSRYLTNSRDPQRTPFQWDNTTSAGFSTNTSVYLKVNENYRTLNLAAQREAEKSYFKNFQAATRLRNTTVGKLGNLTTRVIDDVVLAFSRELDGHDPLLVVINWSNSSVTVSLDEFSGFSKNLQVLLMSVHSNAAVGDIVSRSSITLEGHENLVLTTADAKCSDCSTTSEIGCVIPVVRSLLKRVNQSRLISWIYRHFFIKPPFCILNIICLPE